MASPPQNMGEMTPEQKSLAFSMAQQEMEYRVELFNKCVRAKPPSFRVSIP